MAHKLGKPVQELVDRAEEIGWRFTGKTSGGGHPILEHEETGQQYAMSSTPSDHRTVKNHLADLERLAGQKVARHGKRRKSHKAIRTTDFTIEKAIEEQAENHRKYTELGPVADIHRQRREAIDELRKLAAAGGDHVNDARALLWKIEGLERALSRKFGETVVPFTLDQLPIPKRLIEEAKQKVKQRAVPKPKPAPAPAAKKKPGPKPKLKPKMDSLTGEELPHDTEPWRVILRGKEVDLYLSEPNRIQVEELLSGLIANGEPVRKTRKKRKAAPAPKPTPELTRARRQRAAKEGPAAPVGKSSEVRAWLRENGWPDIADRGRFSREQLEAYGKRNAKARREWERTHAA